MKALFGMLIGIPLTFGTMIAAAGEELPFPREAGSIALGKTTPLFETDNKQREGDRELLAEPRCLGKKEVFFLTTPQDGQQFPRDEVWLEASSHANRMVTELMSVRKIRLKLDFLDHQDLLRHAANGRT